MFSYGEVRTIPMAEWLGFYKNDHYRSTCSTKIVLSGEKHEEAINP